MNALGRPAATTIGTGDPEPQFEDAPREASVRWTWFGLASAACVGLVLRLYQLPSQILTGDELHTINAARTWEVSEIIRRWTFEGADYCVPLTAFFRFLFDRGIVLSEMDLRLPSLLAGACLLVFAPLALRSRIGDRATITLAWLLALSPPLLFYSRIVRSYALVILISGFALYAFERWWRQRSLQTDRTSRTRALPWAAAYVGFAGLGVYFHLGALPLLASPFVWAALELGLSVPVSERRSTLVALMALGAVAGTWAGILLFPARESLLELSALHTRGSLPTAAGWVEVVKLTLGTPSLAATAIAVAAITRGLVILSHRRPALGRFFYIAIAVHVFGLIVLRPNFFEAPSVVSRYSLVLVPILMMAMAVGLTAPFESLRLRPRLARLQPWIVATLLIAGFATGPLARPALRTSSFAHAGSFIEFTRAPERATPPAFYATLDSPEEILIEMPWVNLASRAYRTYQLDHGHEVKMALAGPGQADARLDYRNLISPETEPLMQSGADWLVVHMDLQSEERTIPARNAHDVGALDDRHRFWKVLRMAAVRMSKVAEAAWGPPHYSDESIRAWHLSAIRQQPPATTD